MTHRQLLEAIASLMLQIAAVVGVSALLARRLKTSAARDRLWNSCLVALPLLAACDFVLPHLRLIPAALPSAGTGGDSYGQWPVVAAGLVLAAGAAFLSLRLARDLIRLIGLLRSAEPAPEPFVNQIRDLLRTAARPSADGGADPLVVAGRQVVIVFSDSLRSPSCWQLHRPFIALPGAVRQFPAEETALILRHELAHLRFRHPLMLFVQRFVEIAFWAHPAIWWAGREADRTREFRCDDETVTSRSAAAVYLRAILRLASPAESSGAAPGMAVGFGAECPLIVDRAERLASRAWSEPAASGRPWISAAPILCAVAAMVLLWVPVGSAASRRSAWSPWPAWSASVLHSLGVSLRDYEVDGHRLRPGEFHRRAE